MLPSTAHTDFHQVARQFLSTYPQRGLILVISDFLDDAGCEKGLQYLVDFGHELMLLQLWADEDRTPPWLGELDLRDAESGAAMKLDFDEAARRRYTREFDAYCAAIQAIALRSGGRYAGVPVSQPLESLIFGDLIRARGIA